jgi:exodeoxyribonuclease-5
MLEQFIKNRIIAQLPFEANEKQLELLDKLSQFIVSPTPRKAFILRGYAGTGKTSVMAALVGALHDLQQRIVLLAPTGRAAKVLSKYAHVPAHTIHKYIYRQKQLGEDRFSLNDNLHRNTLFIVDEASMISGLRDNPMFGSGMLLEDLVRYVYSGEGCSMLLLGDNAQLPPVGSIQSPALNIDYMSGYQLDIHSHTLTQVARQASDSSILDNATRLRPFALGEQAMRKKCEEAMWDILSIEKDVCTVSGAELLEALEEAYQEVGEEETILLTRTNKRTNIYNQGIRTRILWREDEISSGDRLMVCKNNYFWTEKYDDLPFLANGDLLEVVRLRNEREMYGYHFVDAQLR